MGTKSYRVSISFDTSKEKDIINWINKLGETRKLGEVLTNLIRVCFTDNSKVLKGMNTTSLLAERNSFFNELNSMVKKQDDKIDEIYNMCMNMYCLARMNKVMDLESKTDEFMINQFILQNMQGRLKSIIGDNSLHVYMSDKLPNEKDKADKIFEYIASAYEAILMEIKTSLAHTTPVYIEKTKSQDEQVEKIDNDDEVIELTQPPVCKSSVKKDISQNVQELDDDDEIIELTQPPVNRNNKKKDDYMTIQELDENTMDAFLAMMGED